LAPVAASSASGKPAIRMPSQQCFTSREMFVQIRQYLNILVLPYFPADNPSGSTIWPK
jgi:hypothetical protein